MKTIPQLLAQREAERQAYKAQARFRSALHLSIVFVVTLALAAVLIHFVGSAIEKAAYDAIDARERPVKW